MHGVFVWYELMTRDEAAAAAFYGAVVGWEARPEVAADITYTILGPPGCEMGVAGMMALSPEDEGEEARPGWIGYIAVDDVDAAAAQVMVSNGAVLRQPASIPGIGRFAIVADPQGAVFCLFRPELPEGPLPPSPQPGAPGTFGWRELLAGDAEAVFTFYEKLFGWEKGFAMDMGAMGTCQCFDRDGQALGGMMTAPPQAGPPAWTFFINVEAIDAAAARVSAAGGRVLHGPDRVPGDAWIVNCRDPEGSAFSLLAMKR